MQLQPKARVLVTFFVECASIESKIEESCTSSQNEQAMSYSPKEFSIFLLAFHVTEVYESHRLA